MSRLEAIPFEQLSKTQKQVYENLVAGPRKGAGGPFAIWMYSEIFCELAQRLGLYCRYENSLGAQVNELLILMTCKSSQCRYAWHRHVQMARDAGVDAHIIEAIRNGTQPDFGDDDEKQRSAFDFFKEITESNHVTEHTWLEARDSFGARGIVDIIGIIGYYQTVCMTLNAAQTGFDEPDPFTRSASLKADK